MALAEFGGHLRSNGPPGWAVLGRALERLLLIEIGWNQREEAVDDWRWPDGYTAARAPRRWGGPRSADRRSSSWSCCLLDGGVGSQFVPDRRLRIVGQTAQPSGATFKKGGVVVRIGGTRVAAARGAGVRVVRTKRRRWSGKPTACVEVRVLALTWVDETGSHA